MAFITCFGEASMDFLSQPQANEQSSEALPTTSAIANVAVAVATLGGSARFISQLADDAVSEQILTALAQREVDTSLVQKQADKQTTLALTVQDIKDQWFINSAVFHFSSNTLTEPSMAETTLTAISKARKQGNLVTFDVNLQPHLWPNGKVDQAVIERCFASVDMVKLSQQELELLSPEGEIAFVKSVVAQGVSFVVITDETNAIKVIAKGIYSEVTPPTVEVVDATAAGDAFMGALLFALVEQGDSKKTMADQQKLEQLTLFASRCGAHAVTKPGAFDAMPSLDDIAQAVD
ncbi:PfkB family carbohydrate kinase [Reinekea thalattae]|uniref:Carbohydrate kinase n=1 Tax=Reinekea thalattae TaxID=2593301 RepID=A0A5C8ZB35_9GAMM|nr:PfkB family carbohydrate kinase [Reinekea thalattae]TXR54489.1 carbohydrate kinase [Reinekea thalattae]